MDLRAVDQLRTLLKVEVEPVLCDFDALTGSRRDATEPAGDL